MVERQFAEFLLAQMKTKVDVLGKETEHAAVPELQAYIDQLDTLLETVLQDQPIQKLKGKRSRVAPSPE